MLTHPCRLLDWERKKKKKFHQGSSALKERLKYYELILKRLQGFINEGHNTAFPTTTGHAAGVATAGYTTADFDDDSAVWMADMQ